MPRSGLLAAAACVLLAGCAGPGGIGGTRVFNERYELIYSAAEVRTIGGAMPTQIFGTPPDGASAEEVAAAMTLPGRFNSRPAEIVPPGTKGKRLVLAFFRASGERLCEGPGGAAGAPGDGTVQMFVSAAFCINERYYTAAQLSSTETRGPRDAAFRPAMLQLYGMLLPARNPEREADRPFRVRGY